MRAAMLSVFLLLALASLNAQVVPGSLDVHWNPGAPDCKANSEPPLQVHRYEAQTIILRQNLCISGEGNFLYLLIGSKRALLIDDGAVADPAAMPVARTVLSLLPVHNGAPLPLLVAHTHRHGDHRGGDPQFAGLANVEVVPYDIEGVKRYYGFSHWPHGQAEIDLGDRVVDVLPSPGHNATHLVFYDRRTALLFTGDFLMAARLIIDDIAADRASADRVIAFARSHPIAWVLGAHIEENAHGELYSFGTHYHPDEHQLQLTQNDLLQLPDALAAFNGLYTHHGEFIMLDQFRLLGVQAAAAFLVLVVFLWLAIRVIRRWRRNRKAVQSA